MSRYEPDQLKAALRSGLLCFPVTHATPDLRFDEKAYQAHLEWLASYGPAGMTAAGGTGEFFALTLAEAAQVIRAAVRVAPRGTAIMGAAGYGTATAVEMARDVERAGADGLFLLPPYLTEIDQEGLVEHVRRVCAATSLGVLVYHRAQARFTAESVARLAEECPNLVAFKDGIGDLDLISRLAATVGDRLVYVDGLPTSEINASAYLAAGAATYSSAIFNFLPGWAMEFHAAVRAADRDEVARRLRDFVVPFLGIRDRRPGYAVSIVKAGMRAVGRPAGPVRPPLTDLTGPEYDQLAALIGRATVEPPN
ncbi:5-dehydro-4-deoxyglucarate dehydratase [Nonomuraea sp. M3C6]|uniref:Probable 5-dehydro-4-deoxyglucarate dehydratase n=1 Tax=Nonomuraea marmarensis TaxID=3351344 RepID=A0ABW7AHY4_9ACTN